MAELPAQHVGRFSYYPLGHGEIRLLRIYPGGSNDRIYFSVLHIHLRHARDQFTALSYTWGALNPVQLLIHYESGERLPVTPNCERAIDDFDGMIVAHSCGSMLSA